LQTLEVKRVRFSKEADTWLRVLKSRTGVTPNLLCRIGFCVSLEEPGTPDPSRIPEDSEREINRYTLLGQYDSVFAALLKTRLARDGVNMDDLDEHFRAHMNRGVTLLAGRVKSAADFARVVGKPE
jgi:DNA sulfur modification protein DndE